MDKNLSIVQWVSFQEILFEITLYLLIIPTEVISAGKCQNSVNAEGPPQHRVYTLLQKKVYSLFRGGESKCRWSRNLDRSEGNEYLKRHILQDPNPLAIFVKCL